MTPLTFPNVLFGVFVIVLGFNISTVFTVIIPKVSFDRSGHCFTGLERIDTALRYEAVGGTTPMLAIALWMRWLLSKVHKSPFWKSNVQELAIYALLFCVSTVTLAMGGALAHWIIANASIPVYVLMRQNVNVLKTLWPGWVRTLVIAYLAACVLIYWALWSAISSQCVDSERDLIHYSALGTVETAVALYTLEDLSNMFKHPLKDVHAAFFRNLKFKPSHGALSPVKAAVSLASPHTSSTTLPTYAADSDSDALDEDSIV